MNNDSMQAYAEKKDCCKQEEPTVGAVDTDGGRFQVEWDREEPLTRFGSLVYFAHYLHESGRYERWWRSCPLKYSSPNAPEVRDVLGTGFLSILAGQTRYSHIGSLSGEQVAAETLGMTRVISHDAFGRALKRGEEADWESWQMEQMLECCGPLLTVEYILDTDVTVKPLYGHQEGAEVGYNPRKPGRPSHAYHVFQIGLLRMVLWVEVLSGKDHAGKHGMPGLWRLLHRLPRRCWPKLIRGDIGYGNDGIMTECEHENVLYLFRLRMTAKVKELIQEWRREQKEWTRHADGYEIREGQIQLGGWGNSRRIVVIRKQTSHEQKNPILPAQSEFEFVPPDSSGDYEYEVLVSNQPGTTDTWYPVYRQRPDSENTHDEFKNQWCWTGFTTHDLKRCRIMARMTALVANWWNIFCRLAEPTEHKEAITSKPQWLENLGRLTYGGRQRTIKICCKHSAAETIRVQFNHIANVLQRIRASATQLTADRRWALILSVAFVVFLKGTVLQTLWEGNQLVIANI